MAVEMAVVKAGFVETRALEPHMIGRSFTVPSEAWATAIEDTSQGKIRRIGPTEETPKRKRGRPRKVPA